MNPIKNLELAARAMGYRKLDPNQEIWAKPFGYGMLIINRTPWRIEQLFRGVQTGEIACYTSADVRKVSMPDSAAKDESLVGLLSNIKVFEAESTNPHAANTKMDMHFLEAGEDLIILSGVVD